MDDDRCRICGGPQDERNSVRCTFCERRFHFVKDVRYGDRDCGVLVPVSLFSEGC
ncbi:MAG TPA: hypothetical protein VIO14_12265 [Dehalococcoidia bacterium]